MENEVNEPAVKYGYISAEEYFEMEETTGQRFEYYDGFLASVGGFTVAHALISANVFSLINRYLEGKECKALTNQVKIHASKVNSYVYPDVTIFCEQMEFHDEKRGIVLNPSIVFEVLSKTSEDYDMGQKLMIYQSAPSVKEYFMIDSRMKWVRIARREGANLWSFETLTEADSELYIRTLDLRISLNELYCNVLLRFSA
jgi:Uma2 family endonuclease